MVSALDFLRKAQDASGGWGYYPGFYPTTEATATVLLALRGQEGAADMLEGGLRWLRSAQNEDGGWGYVEDDDESGWQTAWAVLAFSKMQIDDEYYRRGVEWLVNVKPLGYRGDDFTNLEGNAGTSDSVVNSWPWYPGEATWVEPTSLAILALQKESANPAVATRSQHAFNYLRERRCPGGGWNVGNPVMFDVALVGRAPQTAQAILALLTAFPNPYDQADVEIMRRDMSEDGSPLVMAWGNLALRIMGLDDSDTAAKVAAMQLENGSWSNNCFHTARVLIAERGSL